MEAGRIDDILGKAQDGMAVRRVFGEPYEKDGITFVPAARIWGGGGGGSGTQGENEGTGGGFGLFARPVGAYRIKGDEVTWIPAADTTRVIVFGQIVAIVALLVFRSIARRRRR
jgi:uncharacterized spore protein YtfJ